MRLPVAAALLPLTTLSDAGDARARLEQARNVD
eukprot:COSAG02_NODE_55688_length_289_cov_0.810526_1_plen_32_part_10